MLDPQQSNRALSHKAPLRSTRMRITAARIIEPSGVNARVCNMECKNVKKKRTIRLVFIFISVWRRIISYKIVSILVGGIVEYSL